MQRRLTSREFTESLAFEYLEPDPAEATMHLVALLVTITANVHRDRDRKPTPFTVDDFLPDRSGPSKLEREAAFAATMAAFAAESKRRREEREHGGH